MIEEEVMEIKQEKMNVKEEAIVMGLKEDQGEEEKILSLVTNFRILILSQINILSTSSIKSRKICSGKCAMKRF